MVFVGVVVGALMTARRARLLDRMSLFWRAFVSVVQYAFVPYCRSDWITDKYSKTCLKRPHHGARKSGRYRQVVS